MKKLDPLEATREGDSPICSKEHGAAIFPQTVYLPMSAPGSAFLAWAAALSLDPRSLPFRNALDIYGLLGKDKGPASLQMRPIKRRMSKMTRINPRPPLG
jgi:hypothetical protein